MASLVRTQLRLAIGVLLILAVLLGGLPLLFAARAGAVRRARARPSAAVAAARGARLPGADRGRDVLRAAGRAQRAGLRRDRRAIVSSPTSRRELVTATRRRMVCRSPTGGGRERSPVRGVGDHGGDRPDRADRGVRAAVLAHDERLLRGVAVGVAGVERVGHRRRVPLGRVVPRHRRADPRLRRGHAVVPGRLHRGLLPAAGARRRTAAPVGRLHAARLRRGPARVARGAPHRERPGRHRSAGSTCCRSSSAPA